MSEQGAGPDLPVERLKELAGPTGEIIWSPTKLLHEAHAVAVQLTKALAQIAALTLERDTLKQQLADSDLASNFANECVGKYMADAEALKAERDALLRALTDEDAAVIHRVTSKVLAARLTPPASGGAKEQPAGPDAETP